MLGFLVAQVIKNLPAVWETWVDPWVGKIPWRRKWQSTPVFLPGESPWTEEPGGLQPMGVTKSQKWLSNSHTLSKLHRVRDLLFNFYYTMSSKHTKLKNYNEFLFLFHHHIP